MLIFIISFILTCLLWKKVIWPLAKSMAENNSENEDEDFVVISDDSPSFNFFDE